MMNSKVFIMSILLISLFSADVKGQVDEHIYYIIEKEKVKSGEYNLMYRNKNVSTIPLKMCYPEMRAEGLTVKDGIVSFHFEKIPSSKYDNVANCISNNTPAGNFTIDLRKDKIGDKNQSIHVPFRTSGFGISVIPYRVRFAQESIPTRTDSKLDLSLMYGWTFGKAKINHERIVHRYITLGAFVGVTSASLKKETVTNPMLLKDERDAIALSCGVTSIFGKDDLGLSLSFGFDIALGENGSLWVHQNEPWVGVGITSKFVFL